MPIRRLREFHGAPFRFDPVSTGREILDKMVFPALDIRGRLRAVKYLHAALPGRSGKLHFRNRL
jgi:hypothetical protein